MHGNKIKYVTKASCIASRVMESLPSFIKPGKTEKQVAEFIKRRIKVLGGKGEAFKIIVASGHRSALVHGYATKNMIRKKSIVLVDLGAYYKGFCSDISRTFYVDHSGKCHSAVHSPEPYRKYYICVKEAQQNGIGLVRAGLQVKKIDQAIRKVFKKNGLEKFYTHTAGHGIGKKVHEAPRIYKTSNEVLKEGEIITVEPGLYFPKNKKRFGIRIEDVVLVEKNGCKILTDAVK